MTEARGADDGRRIQEKCAPVFVHEAEAVAPSWVAAVASSRIAVQQLEAASDQADGTLEKACCALLDASAPRFVHAARAIFEHDASVQVIAVAPVTALAAARRALLYAPGLGEVWMATPTEISSALTERAASVTEQRRRYARTRARMARERIAESPQRTIRALISDSYLAGLLGALPDAVFSVGATGRVLSANRAADLAFGRPDATVLGERLGDVLGTTDWARGDEPNFLRRASSEGALDVTVRTRDGRPGTAEVRAALVDAPDAVRSGSFDAVWAVVVHDVTAQRAAQAELRETALKLEAQADELRASTEELIERTEEAERLRDAAEAASRARADFLAMMSHEIRTPINAIIGYTQLLEIGLPDAATAQQCVQLARIAAAAKHLLGLVDDVLDVAKVDAGEMHVARDRCDVASVIADALVLTRPLANQRHIDVTQGCDDGSLAFVGDEARVRQILVNLLSNAVKFTKPGGSVAISCGTQPGIAASGGSNAGPRTYIRIVDTGIGIAPHQQATVFEPFVQAERGLTRTKGGSGLGLTISRRLAQLMDGDLTLESVLGSGTTFTLWLPAG